MACGEGAEAANPYQAETLVLRAGAAAPAAAGEEPLKSPEDCSAWNEVYPDTGVCKYTECCVEPGVNYMACTSITCLTSSTRLRGAALSRSHHPSPCSRSLPASSHCRYFPDPRDTSLHAVTTQVLIFMSTK